MYISGWGRNSDDDTSTSCRMMVTTMRGVPIESCYIKYRDVLCIHSDNSMPCNRDSGALVVRRTHGCNVVERIASSSTWFDCETNYYRGIFAVRVISFLPWIQRRLAELDEYGDVSYVDTNAFTERLYTM